jgi:inner membrane protein
MRSADVRSPLGLSWLTLAIVTLALAVFDAGSALAGSSTFPGGPLDEAAHLLTTLLFIWAIGGLARRPMIAALVASVAIEIDHVPGRLGADWLTAGTPRPYTHSLLTVVVVLAAAALWRRRRALLLGVAFGLATHLFRDLAQSGSGVSLLWPGSDQSFSLPHWSYAAVMAAVVAVAAWRCRLSADERRRGAVTLLST